MIFESKKYRVSKIIKKTTASGFKDVKEGDILQFSLEMRHTAHHRGGCYALDVQTTHGDKVWVNTQNRFSNYIQVFELKEEQE
jgi:hypothetical protein